MNKFILVAFKCYFVFCINRLTRTALVDRVASTRYVCRGTWLQQLPRQPGVPSPVSTWRVSIPWCYNEPWSMVPAYYLIYRNRIIKSALGVYYTY